MSILTRSSSVVALSSRPGRPVRPVRIAPRPEAPFGAGLIDEPSTPIAAIADEFWELATQLRGIAKAEREAERQADRKPVTQLTAQPAAQRPTPRGERPAPYTAADAQWWAANSITGHFDYDVLERRPRLTWNEWHACAAPDPCSSLSDDHNGGFLGEIA